MYPHERSLVELYKDDPFELRRRMAAFSAWGYLFQGAARAMEGENPAEALRILERSSELFARSRTRVFRQVLAAAMAEAFIHLGEDDRAAAAIDRG